MTIRFHILSNGRKNGLSKIRSFFDFFFPYGEMIRAEMANDNFNNMRFFTFRAAFVHLILSPIVRPFREFGASLRYFLADCTGAIAFDSSNFHVGQGGVTSQTFALTCTGTNRAMWAGTCDQNHVVTGVTFNGVSLTLVKEQARTTSFAELFFLVNPDNGTSHNVVVSLNPAGDMTSGAASYSGVNQSMTYVGGSPTDATNSTNGTSTTPNVSVNTILDNSWTILTIFCGTVNSAGTGSNTVVNDFAEGFGMFDSGSAITPAGSYSMTVNTTNAVFAIIIASLSPVQSAVTPTPNQRIRGHGR